ncbi:4'-phosphopantetheinyl transferase superfamily protein [Lacibacter cauensis]|uniref:Enterobactin synthase component D n=1 Tax=Lacibacter cauensis TaxID=510947 RepID=A0A562SDJ4_9BACT|nr:4'-phosphopantetheinyl transferase superfamily protein [Lacibacter cauensis]TWI79322.1 4'-phosphopantetheinyl transferase superfamily protein [Lacibacter cauensis]
MALVYQHTINSGTKAGLWRIEEPEEFFLEKVPLKRDVSHPHKRLQHLAGRYLLPMLFEDFPLEEILIADTRKPFLPDEKYHFSISHCGDYAAAIVSSTQRVGVDIEKASDKILRVSHKFLTEREKMLLDEQMSAQQLLQLTSLLWSTKESLFKWYGDGGVDFREHMHIENIEGSDEEGKLICSFRKHESMSLTVHYRFLHDLVMSWVVS